MLYATSSRCLPSPTASPRQASIGLKLTRRSSFWRCSLGLSFIWLLVAGAQPSFASADETRPESSVVTTVSELGDASKALTSDSLYRWRYADDPRISPDGRWLAWVRVDTDPVADRYRADLWLTDLTTGAHRQLTTDPENDHSPRFSPDGRSIAFVSKRVDPAQLFLLDLEGGDVRQLTDLPLGVSDPTWSPDGARIAFTSRSRPTARRDQEEAEQQRQQDAQRSARAAAAEALGLQPEEDQWQTAPEPIYLDGSRYRTNGMPAYTPTSGQRLWLLELTKTLEAGEPQAAAAGALYPLTPAQRVHEEQPAFSADGTQIYFASRNEPDARSGTLLPDMEIYRLTLAPEGGEATAVDRITQDLGADDHPLVDPQGRFLLWVGSDDDRPRPTYVERDLMEMALVDRYGTIPVAAQRITNLTSSFPRSVGDGTSRDVASPLADGRRVLLNPEGSHVYFTTADRGTTHLARLDLATRKVTALTRGAGDVYGFAVGPGGLVVAIRATATEPFDLHVATFDENGQGNWRRLSDLQSEVLSATGPRIEYEEISATAEDGTKLQGWLLRPPATDPETKLPLILYIHGGPHAMYGTTFFHEFQTLVDAGYGVLLANPRGSTGYGSAFARSIQGEFPGNDAEDLITVLDQTLASGGFDARRLGVAGGSGGGLLTTWLLGHHPQRFAAAVAQRNVTNWYSFVGTTDIGSLVVERWFRALPWQNPTDYLRRSPIHYAGKIQTPLLIIHSDQDWRTPLEQSEQLYNALRLQGKPVEMLVFPEEHHGLSRGGRPSHRVVRLDAIRTFFDRHLRNSDER